MNNACLRGRWFTLRREVAGGGTGAGLRWGMRCGRCGLAELQEAPSAHGVGLHQLLPGAGVVKVRALQQQVSYRAPGPQEGKVERRDHTEL